jgi:hypothetical protein
MIENRKCVGIVLHAVVDDQVFLVKYNLAIAKPRLSRL